MSASKRSQTRRAASARNSDDRALRVVSRHQRRLTAHANDLRTQLRDAAGLLSARRTVGA